VEKNIHVPVNPTYHEIKNNFTMEWKKKKDNKYWVYRNKWEHNPKHFILEDAPLHLDIEPTNACNLKCPMCPRTVLLNKPSESDFKVGHMQLDTYKKIIDEAVEIGVYSVKLNWLGEPLVHPDIVEMVSYAKRKGIIDVMFNTNGVLLTKEISNGLIEAGLDKLFFSFDSPDKEKYEQIRVGADYDATLNNIKKFIELRNLHGDISTLTRVSMVLMESNETEYNNFVNLFKDITDIVAYVEYRKPIGQDKQGEYFPRRFACSQLWQRMFISWDGDVIVCCVDSEKEYIVGNIHKESIRDIWINDKYTRIRESHKSGNCFKADICKKCDLPYKNTDGSI